ncbi:ABC transporter ATP-binding protein [Kineococcus sp. TBRC 1896]|uniref:ABC transporter ATP-binding protein n=1 Tax=Kineococcus mangrovi TaxID=1660183 RepID=A0ABV4I5Q3_9ACTN
MTVPSTPVRSTTVPSTTGTALLLEGVTRTYPGPVPVHALQGVSLAVDRGSFTAVMGPSGSGKSTLLHVASGLDTPTAGRVVVGGTEIDRLSPDAATRFRRDHVGFVFQGYDLVRHLTVAENIGLPLTLAGRRAEPTRVAELLESVGLPGTEDRLPAELSGGQAQRVAIARALVSQPDVLFADEPTGALDRATSERTLALLRHVADGLGQTVVLVTHDPAAAAAADRTLFLADGRFRGELEGATAGRIAARLLELAR